MELEQCQAEHGCSPLELLDRHGFLGPTTTVVHAIHVSDADVDLLARTGSIVAACPTTEANLGDGFVPAPRYRSAGVRLAIGSDSNVRIDPFEETRELETIARRLSVSRNGLLAGTGDPRRRRRPAPRGRHATPVDQGRERVGSPLRAGDLRAAGHHRRPLRPRARLRARGHRLNASGASCASSAALRTPRP